MTRKIATTVAVSLALVTGLPLSPATGGYSSGGTDRIGIGKDGHAIVSLSVPSAIPPRCKIVPKLCK